MSGNRNRRLFLFLLAVAAASATANAQTPPPAGVADVVCFKHTLRWAEESNFPNYFLIPGIRDSVFQRLGEGLKLKFGVADVRLPQRVEYRMIMNFGKSNPKLPETRTAGDYEVGVFSFITRKTVGSAMTWSLTVIVKRQGKILLEKAVKHELEHFSVSGYFTNQAWMTPGEFAEICDGMIREALGLAAPSPDRIEVGSPKKREGEALAMLPQSTRYLLMIHGYWMKVLPGSGGALRSFGAKLVRGEETVEQFTYKDGWDFFSLQFPGISDLLAGLFTEATGLGLEYASRVRYQQQGTMVYADKRETRMRLRWLEEITRTTTSDEQSARTIQPIIGEIYKNKSRVGEFVYTRSYDIVRTDASKIKYLVAEEATIRLKQENTLGWGWIHRINGVLGDRPFSAVYDDRQGFILISTGDSLLAVMVVQNCNPASRTFGGAKLSKNKVVRSQAPHIGALELTDNQSLEWYPVFIAEGGPENKMDFCLEILTSLFFGIEPSFAYGDELPDQ